MNTIKHRIYTATDLLLIPFSTTLEAALEMIEVWRARRERRDRVQRASCSVKKLCLSNNYNAGVLGAERFI